MNHDDSARLELSCHSLAPRVQLTTILQRVRKQQRGLRARWMNGVLDFTVSWRRRFEMIRDIALAVAQCHAGCLTPRASGKLPLATSDWRSAATAGAKIRVSV